MQVINKPFINIKNKDQTNVSFQAKDLKPAEHICSNSSKLAYNRLIAKFNDLKKKIKLEPNNDELVTKKVELAAELLQEANKMSGLDRTIPLISSKLRLNAARKDLYKVNERRYNDIYNNLECTSLEFYTAKCQAAVALLRQAEVIGSIHFINNSRKRFDAAERELVAAEMKANLESSKA